MLKNCASSYSPELREREAAPVVMTLRLSFRFLAIGAGDLICFAGEEQLWLVVGRTLENIEIALECVAWSEAAGDAEGDPGRANRLPVASGHARRIGIVELPVNVGTLAGGGIVIGVSADQQWQGA